MASAVSAFFAAYNQKLTLDARRAFLSSKLSDSYTGRTIWRKFVSDNWRRWGVQKTIFGIFEARNMTYFQIMMANEQDTIVESIPVHEALDKIASTLFGGDSLDANSKLKYPLRKAVLVFANNASKSLRSWTAATIKRYNSRRKEIDGVLSGESLSSHYSLPDSPAPAGFARRHPSIDEVKALTKVVTAFKKDVKFWPTEEHLEHFAQIEAELAQIWESLGGMPNEKPSSSKKGVDFRLRSLAVD